MKILLIQLKRIGDLILTTPAIRCLREAYPDAEITLITNAASRGLLRAVDVDECLVHDKRGGNDWIWRKLPRLKPDWCFDFSGTDRAMFLSAISGAKRKINFERFRKRFLRGLLYTDFVDSSVRDRHTADHYTDLLRPLGVVRENVPLDLRLPSPADTLDLLNSHGVSGPYAVIHAGTARPEKYWLPERWAEVAGEIQARHGLLPVFTGAASPEEASHLSAIQEAMKVPSVNLAGATDLAGLCGVIAGAKLFCGVDTAAMHLADAMLTPLVALFGPTNPYHWRPRHARAIVLRASTREPFDPMQKGGAMGAIETRSVKDAVLKLLDN